MFRQIFTVIFTLLIIVQSLPIDRISQYPSYNSGGVTSTNRNLLLIKRHDQNIRNCYFSPVQCLLPVSDSTIRMFRLARM
uniref:Secreted protein n=1 Tax=Panagrolaimus davidi TaxID=227884 RepID=A0A914PQH0_9BILA